MSFLDKMEKEPYRFDVLDVMRRIERTLGRPIAGVTPTVWTLDSQDGEASAPRAPSGPRPRIGDSATRRDEVIQCDGQEYLVSFGQEPHLEFPPSNVARVDIERDSTRKRIRVYSKFLGLLGPQGGLPFPITEEAFRYMLENDDALPRFLDVFNQRFLQLFFRAWADSRPLVHHDRPDHDRFASYVLSTIGVGSTAFAGAPHTPPGIGLYAGLLSSQAKSASRLRYAIKGLFGVEVEIDEFVGTWLEIDESERTSLGSRNSGLGTDLMAGKSSFSVQDKIRIRIFVDDLEAYGRFLPEGEACERLVDLVFFYIGDEFEWDVELALPASKVVPTRLEGGMALGWTSWMSPNYPADEYRCDARFNPAERAAHRRRKSQ
jgi:type VI secretion system protein ImpH